MLRDSFEFLPPPATLECSPDEVTLITVGDALRALVTVVVAAAADAADPFRTATGLLVEPVSSSLAFLGRVEAAAADGFAALMAVSAADCDRSLCRMVTLAPLPENVDHKMMDLYLNLLDSRHNSKFLICIIT